MMEQRDQKSNRAGKHQPSLTATARLIFVAVLPFVAISSASATYPQDRSDGRQLRGVGQAQESVSRGLGWSDVVTEEKAAEGVCSNGLEGIEKSGVCCSLACGGCGGEGCASFGGLGASECCVSGILLSGEVCDASDSAPCVIDSGTDGTSAAAEYLEDDGIVCGDTLPGVASSGGAVCCVAECGTCGGEGCGDRGGSLGEDECCVSNILDSNKFCEDTGAAPCLMNPNEEANDDDEDASNDDDEPDVAGDIDGDGKIDGYVLVDCYQVESADPFFFSVADTEGMTPEMCFHICADKSSTYFGITKGYECGCGIATNFLDTEKPEGTCETPCRGDAKQTCGDETSYDLFRLYDNKADEEFDYSVLLCSNGMNGVMNEEEDICCPASCLQCGGSRCVGQGSCCDGYVREKEQYCNEDVYLPPCVLRPDGGDAGAEYVSTSVAAEDLGPIPTPAPDAPAVAGDKDGDGGIDGFLYNGCFGFETQNPFNLLLEEDMKPEMTPEMCFDLCATESAAYMGLMEGTICGCGDDASFMASSKPAGSCDKACNGDSKQMCGGASAYNLFELKDSFVAITFDENSTCSNSISGVESASGLVCCPASCGQCGGSRCVGQGSCCDDHILKTGKKCSTTVISPCILD